MALALVEVAKNIKDAVEKIYNIEVKRMIDISSIKYEFKMLETKISILNQSL